MGILGSLIVFALQIYVYILIGRLIIDLLISVNPGFRPKGVFLPISEILLTLTDPPLRFIRRFIKPVRFGAISLDFGWTLLVIGILFIRGIIEGLI